MTLSKKYPRAQWPRLLSSLPAKKVRSAAKDLEERHSVVDITLPQAGLGLLQLLDGALSDRYFIGEVPLSRAHVKVTTGDGVSAEGAAQMLDDRLGLVRAIAIIDAVLANVLPGHENIYPLLEEGYKTWCLRRKLRANILRRTRVDFSLLGEGEDEL